MKQEEIEVLLERYLDGNTTNEEEKLLRCYFNETQLVSPEWRYYKVLFHWEHSQSHNASQTTNLRPRRMAVAAAIAALLLVGAGITTALIRQSVNDKSEQQQDYAIIDGRLTTDAVLIAQEAEQALMMVTTTEEETLDALNILQL